MKVLKKIIVAVMLFVLVFTLTDIPAISSPAIAQAVTVKLNKKTLILEVGKSQVLKLSGTKKTIKWSSSDKAIATVTSKGKVTGKAVGQAKITAAVGTKKYTCTVTVTDNSYLANAPFDATEINIGSLSFVMPTGWKATDETATDNEYAVSYISEDSSIDSSIMIDMKQTDGSLDYSTLKATFDATFTQDYFNQAWKAQLGDTAFEITDFIQSDMDTSFGQVYRLEYLITADDNSSLTQIFYGFYVDDILITVVTTDSNNLDLAAQTDYMINSITIK